MSTSMRITVALLFAVAGAGPALAQSPSSGLDCDNGWRGGGRSSSNVCEMRELTLPARDSLSIDSSPNGGIRVTAWDRDEIRVRAQVQAWARTEDAARETLDQVKIETDGALRADGPRGSGGLFDYRNGSWNVSFEIMAPRDTELRLETVNGGIAVADMRGDVDAETTNGGISFDNVSANVRGRTTNGGISVGFVENSIDGDEFDVRTTNGGVVLSLPEDFSARLDIGTTNGGLRVHLPMSTERRRSREVRMTLGHGGPLLRVRTTNGGVQVRQD